MTENAISTNDQRLSGHLGTVGIVFMVVAAAAPLTVIGGNMPLAHGPRQRRRALRSASSSRPWFCFCSASAS